MFSSGAGELVTVSVFRDRTAATASDELAMAFVRSNLDDLDIQRTDTAGGGEIVVSRVSRYSSRFTLEASISRLEVINAFALRPRRCDLCSRRGSESSLTWPTLSSE